MSLSRRQFIQTAGAITVSFNVPSLAAESSAAISGVAKLGNRLTSDTSGTIQRLMGKVELGQGIGTALVEASERQDSPFPGRSRDGQPKRIR